jgi:hypothetical protein
MTPIQQSPFQDMKPGEAAGTLPLAALQPMTEAYLAFWRNAGRFQTEMLRFVTERMEKDVAHSGRLLHCKTPSDFMQTQMEFLNSFFDDYTKEGRLVGEIMNGAGKETGQAVDRDTAARQKH